MDGMWKWLWQMSSLVTLVPRPSSPWNVEGGFGDETSYLKLVTGPPGSSF